MKLLLQIITIYLVLIFAINNLIAQKNQFDVSYKVNFTKTLFTENIKSHYIDIKNSKYIHSYLEENPPKLFLITKSFNFSYERLLKNNYSMGIGGRSLRVGQRSRFAAVKDLYGNIYDKQSGTAYHLTLDTYEVNLLFKKTTNLNANIKFAWYISPTINLYHTKKDFFFDYSRETGVIDSGNTEHGFFNFFANRSFFSGVKIGLRDKYFRIGTYIGTVLEFATFIKNMNLTLGSEVGYYSKLLTNDPRFLNFSPDGNVFVFSLTVGSNYLF